MSKHNRDRKKVRNLRKVLMFDENHPEYSLETLERMAALTPIAQVNKVAIFHEQFCANALRRVAKKCLCRPDIKVLDPDNLEEERDKKAFANHWYQE